MTIKIDGLMGLGYVEKQDNKDFFTHMTTTLPASGRVDSMRRPFRHNGDILRPLHGATRFEIT